MLVKEKEVALEKRLTSSWKIAHNVYFYAKWCHKCLGDSTKIIHIFVNSIVVFA
jgi:hypothetical protein